MTGGIRRVTGPLRIERYRGAAVRPWLSAVAPLRIAVFRDWPYLYEGELAYEADYLAAYAASPRSVFVLAFDGDRVIGAATGIPLVDDGAAFQQPFRERGLDPATVFYFGESVLLPDYRGLGIGHAFFDHREAHARELGGYTHTAFAAVDRADTDPRRPAGHRGHEVFWSKRGYQRQPGMTMHLSWREVGAAAESSQPLTFWLRALDPV